MKIIVNEIPSDGLELKISEEGRFGSIKAVSPYEAIIKVIKKGNDVFLNGLVKCSIELQCSRCLSSFSLTINSPLDVVLRPVNVLTEEGYELQKDELDVGFYRDNIIDIEDIVNEQLALDIPMKPLCAIECKGICPECGTDLNNAQCSCNVSDLDKRFKILEKLIKHEE